MSRVHRIEEVLKNTFQPSVLEVANFSHEHNVQEGADSHIRVLAVSDQFEGLRRVKRHRLIYSALTEELENGLHALQLDLHATSEWNAKTNTLTPPRCHGGE